MGKKMYPIKRDGGLDIDGKWQIPLVESWLREEGYTERDVPEWIDSNTL